MTSTRYIHLLRTALLFMLALSLLSCATASGPSVPAAETDPVISLVENSGGHVVFFFAAGMEYAEHRPAFADYIFYYERSKKGIEGSGYTHSYHSKLPIRIRSGDLTISLGTREFSQDAGYVFIKPGGRFRVVYGVHKDADIVKMAREYLSRK